MRQRRRIGLWAVGLVIGLFWAASGAEAGFQRMRIASGSYRISGPSFRLPTRCIDPDERAPGRTIFLGARGRSGHSIAAHGPTESRNLNEAMGDWLRFRGDGGPRVGVEILKPG